jgi:4-hydroxybenzoate polyprenyltransferase
VTNDVFDRELDAATKRSKPLVSGAVSLPAAIALALVLIAGAAALSATLGTAGFTLAVLGMACGLAYDVRLKRTLLSALPFMIAIPVLPFWIWATLDEWDGVLWWLAPLGALIGLSLHLANTLPDVADDAAHGVRGLAHALGARNARITCWAAFGAALALAAMIAPFVSYDARIIVPAFAFGTACLALSIIAWWRLDDRALELGFGALAIGAAAAATCWLAAAT